MAEGICPFAFSGLPKTTEFIRLRLPLPQGVSPKKLKPAAVKFVIRQGKELLITLPAAATPPRVFETPALTNKPR